MDLKIKIEDAWGGFWTRGSDGSAYFWDYEGHRVEEDCTNSPVKEYHWSAATQYVNEIKERFDDKGIRTNTSN